LQRTAFVVLLAATLLLLAGCGGSNSNTGTHAFVVNSTGGTVQTYSIQGDGTLTAASSISVGANAECIVLVAAGSGAASGVKEFAYVAQKNQSNIGIFSVDSNGVLTSVGTAQDANFPTNLTTDGINIYAANSSSPGISVFTINTTSGALTLASTTSTAFAPSFLLASGGFLYAAIPTAGIIEAFSINSSSGQVVELPAALGPVVSAGVTPSSLALEGSYLLVADSGGNAVYVFQIQAGQGNLLTVAGSPFTVGQAPSSILVDSASHVYVANQNSNTIGAYSISGGQLSPLTGSPYTVKGQGPVFLTLDPSGNAIYAADSASGGIDEFGISNVNNALTLTALSGSPVTSSGGPVWIAVK